MSEKQTPNPDALAAEQPQPVCPHIRSSGAGDHATHWCALAEQPQPEAVAWPKVNGTARMFDNARALMVIMEREPTDDEMRAFDDAIKGWAAPPPAAPQPEAQPVATLHDDGYWTWKRDDFRRQYETQRAGWRMDVFSAPPPAAPGPSEAQDAARYRWLRAGREGVEFRDGDGKWRADCPGGDDLDQIIDDALRAAAAARTKC